MAAKVFRPLAIIADLAGVQSNVQQMVGGETEVNALRLLQAADEQAGHDEQDQRSGHFLVAVR
jgi:hypothetical protein